MTRAIFTPFPGLCSLPAPRFHHLCLVIPLADPVFKVALHSWFVRLPELCLSLSACVCWFFLLLDLLDHKPIISLILGLFQMSISRLIVNFLSFFSGFGMKMNVELRAFTSIHNSYCSPDPVLAPYRSVAAAEGSRSAAARPRLSHLCCPSAGCPQGGSRAPAGLRPAPSCSVPTLHKIHSCKPKCVVQPHPTYT